VAGFATRTRFSGNTDRSAQTGHALRLKPDHPIGAGQGHYAGAVDGSYGPATERAIPLTAADFERIAAGEIHPPKFPLATREEVARFFDYIISGQADIYLYGL
jgi:hypothetical protein